VGNDGPSTENRLDCPLLDSRSELTEKKGRLLDILNREIHFCCKQHEFLQDLIEEYCFGGGCNMYPLSKINGRKRITLSSSLVSMILEKQKIHNSAELCQDF
jgi:hypothetical protein